MHQQMMGPLCSGWEWVSLTAGKKLGSITGMYSRFLSYIVEAGPVVVLQSGGWWTPLQSRIPLPVCATSSERSDAYDDA